MGTAGTLSNSEKKPPDDPQSDLQQLRHLLLGNDYDGLLHEMASRSETERIAQSLSEAIVQRNIKDQSVAEALGPMIDGAFESAIRAKPQRIVNVIYPIIGPSIRKAVAQSLADMVRTLNLVLESSLSMRALVWRFNAWRAGVKYGEYVLLKTLNFRVEQVLLIHRHTGLLLHSEHAENIHTEDPELVSSMLTAINDFVADSFTRDADKSIDNIKVGEFTLEIESGPEAVLVAAVRGTPSEQVGLILKTSLEKIHRIFARELLNFNGDRDDFNESSGILVPCLIEQRKQTTQRKIPWLAIILIAAIIGFASLKSTEYVTNQSSYQDILATLNETPGYLILGETHAENQLTVRLLRSPTSPTPKDRLKEIAKGSWHVEIQDTLANLDYLNNTLMLLPELLNLNEHVALRNENGKLAISGTLTARQLERLQSSALVESAFAGIDLTGVTLVPDQTQLEQQTREWNNLKAIINSTQFLFQSNSASLLNEQENKLPELLKSIKRIEELADSIPIQQWQIYIVGYADSLGSGTANINISNERANLIKALLAANLGSDRMLLAWGAGYRPGSQLPVEQQRMVSLQLLHTPLNNGVTATP